MRWIAVVLIAACDSGASPKQRESASTVHPEAAAPTDSEPQPPLSGKPIGTAAPVQVRDLADDGSFIVLCEAREDTDHDGRLLVESDLHGDRGDRLRPYLVLGDGPGTPIDEVVSHANSKWIAVVENDRLVLYGGRTRTVLDGDPADDWEVEWTGRAASIAANGTRMTYFRKRGERELLVIRDLATARERIVDVEGEVWRVDVDDAGRWARVRMGASRISFKDRTSPIFPKNCFQGDPHAYGYAARRKPVHTYWLDLETGKLVDDPTIVRAVGSKLLRVLADGSVALDNEIVADASCHASVHAVTTDPPRVLATCGAKITDDNRWKDSELQILGGDHRLATTAVENREADSTIEVRSSRYLCGGHACTEIANGRQRQVDEEVVTQDGDFAVARNAGRWFVIDTRTWKRRELVGASGELDTMESEHGYAAIGKRVYDIALARAVDDPADDLRGLYTSGSAVGYGHDVQRRVLRGERMTAGALGKGPLHWEVR